MITTKKELDETDKKILKMASEGMTAKEIGYNMNKTPRSIEAKIRRMKEYYGCKSITQLVGKLINEL